MTMNPKEFEAYIRTIYGVEPDFPWKQFPEYAVFRHRDNRKWFAVLMQVPQEKLGLAGDDLLNVVNLKCDPVLVGSLQAKDGFFRAYHMNKENWITVTLDGRVEADTIKMLLDMSYRATKGGKKKRR